MAGRPKTSRRARRPLPAGPSALGGAPPGAIQVEAGELKPSARRLYGKVIDTVIDEMGTNGYEATTVARILKVSGASRAFFYRRFGNRESSFHFAYENAIAQVGGILAGCDAELPWAERIRAGIDALLAAADKRPALVRFLLVEPTVAGPWAVRNHRAQLQRLVPLLDEGRAVADRGDELPTHAGTVALGSAVTLLVDEAQAKRKPRFKRLAPDIHFLLLMPYLGPAAASELAHGKSPGN